MTPARRTFQVTAPDGTVFRRSHLRNVYRHAVLSQRGPAAAWRLLLWTASAEKAESYRRFVVNRGHGVDKDVRIVDAVDVTGEKVRHG